MSRSPDNTVHLSSMNLDIVSSMDDDNLLSGLPPGSSTGKESAFNARDPGSIPGSG